MLLSITKKKKKVVSDISWFLLFIVYRIKHLALIYADFFFLIYFFFSPPEKEFDPLLQHWFIDLLGDCTAGCPLILDGQQAPKFFQF